MGGRKTEQAFLNRAAAPASAAGLHGLSVNSPACRFRLGGALQGNTSAQFAPGIYNAGTLYTQGLPKLADRLYIENENAVVNLSGALAAGAVLQLESSTYVTPNSKKTPIVVGKVASPYSQLSQTDANAFQKPVAGFEGWEIQLASSNTQVVLAPTPYTIQYENTMGAQNPNPTTYTILSPAITLLPLADTPTDRFLGWFDASEGGTQVTEIPLRSMGDKTLYACWEQIPLIPSVHYTLTASAGKGGSISPEGTVQIRPGVSQSFTFTADDGWQLVTLEIDGVAQKAVGNSYTFVDVREDHSIRALFLPYTDMNAQSWYASAVAELFNKGVMLGVSDTEFGPSRTTNRGMVTTMLWPMEGSPELEEPLGSPFEDVNIEAYYGEAVRWAQQQEIIGGYSTEQFGPKDPVTREQLATILYRYAEFKGMDVSARNDLSIYTDAGNISSYAREPMEWANAVGLIQGRTATELSPKGLATRAETAVILTRFTDKFQKA